MEITIPTLHLFPALDAELIKLLRSLDKDDWQKPTLAKLWTVKDIATHLLDGNIRTTSIFRDKYVGDPPRAINSYEDIVDYLNRLNADWVKATNRMSPEVLTELLELTGRQYYETLKTLDPFAPAAFSVAWAGEEQSTNWFHIAREFTEKWHHQQQIRVAVNKPGISSREFFYPVIDTFMQALPHTYRNISAGNNTILKITVSGPAAGGTWFLTSENEKWILSKEISSPPTAEVILDPETAWRLFTKGINKVEAEKRIEFRGDMSLGRKVLEMVAIMG
jgi:uncharacterized protein (TIGR03083 family)